MATIRNDEHMQARDPQRHSLRQFCRTGARPSLRERLYCKSSIAPQCAFVSQILLDASASAKELSP